IVKDGDERVLKVVDILEKQTIPPDRKRINDFHEYNGKIYISTKYGISVYDLAKLEFGDTYYIGNGGAQINIVQITVQEPYIFAASQSDGIRRALVADDNLIDYQNWTTIMNGGFRAVAKLGNELYAANEANAILRITPQGNSTVVKNFPSNGYSFRVADDLLSITTNTSVQAYSEGFIEEATVTTVQGFDMDLLSGHAFKNKMYLGTNEDGLLIVPFGSNTPTQI